MGQLNPQKITMDHRLDWYRQAKFGLFIHWGPYSVAGIEASWPVMAPALSEAMFGTELSITEEEYLSLPERFNPVDFDPDDWVRLAKEAGMRYIIFTSKHHDGFCMFDAPGTDYKITNTPFGRDICLELAQACDRAAMPLGFYYSPPDMHHPGYRDTRQPITKNWTGEPKREGWNDYLNMMESHLRKLLTDYGEVRVLWFDGLTNHGKYDPERFHRLVHDLSPETLINDRLGEGYDFITPEQFIPSGIPTKTGKPNPGMDPGGDAFFRTVSALSTMPVIQGWVRKQVAKYRDGSNQLTQVHQEDFPSPARFQPWETCMTMGTSWAYNPHEKNWKAPGRLIRNLVDVVSHGGNYLLNVGPTASGKFPQEAVERLQYVGSWMKAYHPAIYGNTYTPLQGQAWGQVTQHEDKLFLHVYNWPQDGKLDVGGFPGKANSVKLFNNGGLAFSQMENTLAISLPKEAPNPDVSVLEIGIDSKEPGWTAYSVPVSTKITPGKYIKDQAAASFVINAVLNGLIAFISYQMRDIIPYAELSIDILISVFIITFLTSWVVLGGTRKEIRKGNIALKPIKRSGVKLPKSEVVSSLLISLVCVLVFGGLFLDGLIYLISPGGVSNWVYIVLKTLYTGASGALASALTILSALHNPEWKEP